MNETKRTLMFLVVAAASVGIAAATYYGTRPKVDDDYRDVGKEFYPDFQDPTAAQMLRVVAYDPETASVKDFKVDYKDGKWRIPSHLNYPADGKDRLARTAASVIGATRVAFKTRTKSQQAGYDVVDPEDPDPTVLKGRGQKITIGKSDGTVLAEFVIGKKLDGQTDAYYVRGTKTDDPDAIYIAKLKLDLSTKFSDWVEPDLLKVDRENLSDIRVNNYSIDETQGVIVPGEVNELTKKSASDSWTLAGIKPNEELKTDVVNQLVNNIDGLKLVGVRAKPEGLKADLSLDPKIVQSREQVVALRNDMITRGFFPIKSEKPGGKARLVSKEGDLEVGTNTGVRYALNFGQIFTGTEFEIETGLSKDNSKDPAKSKDGSKPATSAKDDKKPAEGKDSLKKSRYLMVYASFDPKLLGEPPVKPTEPKKPDGIAAPASPKNKQSSNADADDANMLALALPDGKDDQKAQPKSNPAKPDSAAKSAPASKGSGPVAAKAPPAPQKPAPKKEAPKPAPPKKPDPKAEYDKAMTQYKKDVERYENDKSEYEKKIKKGEEKVKDLNDRFGPWYYVISAESFENLRLSRASLVKPKDATADKKGPAGLQLPTGMQLPGGMQLPAGLEK